VSKKIVQPTEVFNRRKDYPAGTLFVGADIGKGKHCARALNNRDDRQSEPLFFRNCRAGFEKLVERIGKWCRRYDCDNVVIGMEPTGGYWMPLFGYLEEMGFEMNLVSSLKVKRSKDLLDNSPLKSDRKDALLIARLVREGNVLDFRKGSRQIRQVKDLLKLADDLDKTISVYKNRLEYFISVHFPEIGSFFDKLDCPTMRTLLRKYPFPADIVKADFEDVQKLLWRASRGQVKERKAKNIYEAARTTVGLPEEIQAQRWRIQVILDMLDLATERFNDTKKLLEKALGEIPMSEIIDSIQGIDVMGTAAVIAALGDLRQYRNVRQALKKAGLNLYRFSSGKYRGKDRISRRGMALLRKYLFMAALSHTRLGAAFYEKYRSMVNRGVPKKKALVAIMRKLLKVAFALVRDNRFFEVDYESARRADRDVIVIQRAEKVA